MALALANFLPLGLDIYCPDERNVPRVIPLGEIASILERAEKFRHEHYE